MLVGGNDIAMKEVWWTWPDDLDKIVKFATDNAHETNVYFTAHLFSKKDSHKEFALSSRTIQADLDEGIPSAVRQPSIMVQTSPGRHQGFWLLKETVDPETLEGLSRALTYSIPHADRSGWSLGHKMRVPDTLNHKYKDPKKVHVVSSALITYDFAADKELDARRRAKGNGAEGWIPAKLTRPTREVYASVRRSIPKKVRDEYDVRQADRSESLYYLMISCFRAGLDRNEVFWVAKASANNKFADNKYNEDVDLAKDVIRAEEDVQRKDVDGMSDIERVAHLRKMNGTTDEKRLYIATFVRERLQQMGTFISTNDGQDWYTTETEGRPTQLTRHNDHFNGILEENFGLNAVEPEQRYTLNYLLSKTKIIPVQGTVGILSHYDVPGGRVLVHTGRRTVLHVDATGISKGINGDLGVVFPWRVNEEPFDPDIQNPLGIERLFEGCFENLDEMQPQHALALMRAWMTFLLLRTDAISRPILALFGQPGSGKSTLVRRIYAFLYGRSKSINSITSPEDFDHVVSTDPFVMFDNVDSYEKWLPDRLALSAALSVVSKRKLYTDNDDVFVQRSALIGVTAHNPQFRREDIVDRMLMFNFHRLDVFRPESRIMEDLNKVRNRLWGGLLEDIRKTLATPQPTDAEIPSFRVNDFARIGLWTARANDYEADFTSAVATNTTEQVSFNLEEEDLLVDTIKRWLERTNGGQDKYVSVADLWSRWRIDTRDEQNFERAYRNALKLGRKLWALHATLKSVFDIDFKYDGDEGKRLWRIRKAT